MSIVLFNNWRQESEFVAFDLLLKGEEDFLIFSAALMGFGFVFVIKLRQ